MPTTINRLRATGIAVVVGVVCTVPTLGRQPLSWDEATTLRAARLPFGQLGILLRHTDAPLGFYYALMHAWLSTAGLVGIPPNAAVLRLPSALAVLGSIVLLVRLADEWFDPTIAVIAGILLAVHPMVTFYAQDARPYALVMFVFLISVVMLRRALAQPTWLGFGAYSGVVAVLLYLHLFAVYAVVAEVVLVWRAGDRRRPEAGLLWRWLIAVAVAVASTSPLLLAIRSQSGAIGWIPSASPGVIADVVNHLLGGVGFVVVFVVASIIIIVRRRGHMSAPVFLWAWAVLPPAALVAADFVTPDLVARYGLIIIPAVVLIVALTVRAAPRLGRVVVCAGIAAALVATVVQQVAPYKYEDYRSAADYVGDAARPGAAIVFLPVSMRDGYRPYTDHDGVSVTDPLLAAASVQAREPALGGDERSIGQAGPALRRASEIFLFGYTVGEAEVRLTGRADQEKLRLLRSYRVVRTVHYGEVWVSVLERGSTPVG